MIQLVWEAPLAALSFVFYRGMRFIMRRLVVLNSRRKGELGYIWGVVSPEPLNRPLALPAIMTTAPRWNTHAIIGGAGPVRVKESVALNVETLNASAGVWTAVVYRFPGQQLAGLVGSVDGPFDEALHTIPLAPGEYNFVIRLYHVAAEPRLPEVLVDGKPAIPSAPVEPRTNEFYHELKGRRGPLYSWLHYYVWILLRRGAPRSWVEPELLPMGNPETRFLYGPIERGESLEFTVSPETLADQDVYCTVYTRDSFPAEWFRVDRSGFRSDPAAEPGFYLVRVHRKRPAAGMAADDALRIERV